MSIKQQHLDWAFAQRTITPELKITLLTLAFFAKENGQGTVSESLIADRTGVTPTAAKSSVAALERFGMIYASTDPDGTIIYRLNFRPAE